MKKISVILTSYNQLDLLKITLNNLFQQTLPPSEIIVVDDGSSDETVDYLTHEQANKVILIQTHRKGMGRAYNAGLAAAKGDFIKYMNCEHLLTNNTLAEQAKLLAEEKTAAVYSPWVKVQVQETELQQEDAILQYKELPQRRGLFGCMVHGYFMSLECFLFRREFINKIGRWREDIVAFEQWDYLWRIAKLNPMLKHTNACLTLFRTHSLDRVELSLRTMERNNSKQIYLKQIINSNLLGWKDWLIMSAEWWAMESKLTQLEMPLLYRFINRYKENRKAHELKLTKTDWELMYKPNNNPEVFKQYLNLINN